mgnify:CR=1 FL=1
MSHRLTTPIDALAAPSADGELLISPDGSALLPMVEANRRRMSQCDALLLDRPIREWRQEVLRDKPVILTGHQPAFFHAGVWIKNAVASDLARRVGGAARFLMVDSDQSRGVELQRPGVREGYVHVDAQTAVPSLRASAYEQLPVFTGTWWRDFLSRRDDSEASKTLWPRFVQAFCGDGESTDDYVSRWMRTVSVIDQTLDVSLDYVRISQTFDSCPSAHAFAAHLLLNADHVAAVYNESLAEYRSRRGIRGRAHPIPDLAVSSERVELPLWLLDDAMARRRLFVTTRGNTLEISADDMPVGRVARSELQANPGVGLANSLNVWRIRPRALALTLHARLLCCDLFVHGVGGAKYDQITDSIIRRLFGIAPPTYACASATLRLPMPRFDVLPHERIAHVQRLRDIRWNPQRIAPTPSPALLAERTTAILEASRLREHNRRNRSARRAAFERIRRANRALTLDEDALARAARDQLMLLDGRLASNRIAESREWFVALHDVDRMKMLRQDVADAIAR